RVVDDAVHDAERTQRESPGLLRRGERGIQTREIRAGDAPPLAVAAQVTLRSAILRLVLRQHREAHVGDEPLAAELLQQELARMLLRDVHGPRFDEIAVRELRQPLLLSLHAHEPLDMAPPGRHVRVADRPVDPDAVARVGLVILVAPAEDAPPPHYRAAAHLASPDPRERLVLRPRLRIVPLVAEELARLRVPRPPLLLHG